VCFLVQLGIKPGSLVCSLLALLVDKVNEKTLLCSAFGEEPPERRNPCHKRAIHPLPAHQTASWESGIADGVTTPPETMPQGN